MTRAVVLSLVGHALLLWLVMGPLPHAFDRTTQFAILDRPAATKVASAPAPSRHRTPPRLRHVGRPAPLAPAPAPAADPLPLAPAPSPTSAGTVGGADSSDDGIGFGDPGGGGQAPVAAVGEPDRTHAPDFDEESCTRGVTYPWKARMLDREGVVHLRVVLDAQGRVVAATVLQKAGYGFDETAREAVLSRCQFTAALDRRGRPTPYVIDDYRYHFRFQDFFHDGPQWRPTKHTWNDGR